MSNIAVLASGNGSNFEAIAKSVKDGYIPADIKMLITDNEGAYVRQRAKKFGIKDLFVDPEKFSSPQDFDGEIVSILKKEGIGLVALAGYMRILGSDFLKAFLNRILNIHPAILPAFRGANAIARAYRYGCKVTGVTVHIVDEQVDHGPIILQEAIKIDDEMKLEDLEKAIHKLEHKLYPQAIRLLLENKIKIEGRHVKIV